MKRKFVKILSIILLVFTLAGSFGAVGFVAKIRESESFVVFDSKRLNKVYSSLTVLDNDGKPLQEALYFGNIKQIPLSSLNRQTYMAFVSVEDKRFFDHNGIDLRRVAGATISNLKSKSFKEGASTISQQLIKNTHLDNEKTFKRKVNEMFLARELEKKFTKKEILEMYLNTIYFGRNAYGIENASNVYFDKSAKELTVSESATLAGMIKAPNVYAPDKNLKKCTERRNLVLKLMQEQKVITQMEYEQALMEEIRYTPQKKIAEKTYMYYVLKEACSILNMTECQLLNSNYVIETYCDQEIQKQILASANKQSVVTKNGQIADLSFVLANNQGGIIGCYLRGEGAEVKRQVGSALKPIAVYTPAFNERIITQASPILDEPTNFNGYTPTNAGGYNGWTTIKNAVAKSLNIPAVKTLNALTLPVAEQYLKKLGFDGEQNLSLALGNIDGGMSPFELLYCYTTLANEGKAVKPSFIKTIKNKNSVIYTAPTQYTQVFSPTATYLMTDLLVNVTNVGTAKSLANKNYQIACKTGTVGSKEGNTDALVAGYTTKNTFIAWYSGQFDNEISGSNAPCQLTKEVLNTLYQYDKPVNFVPPKNVVQLSVDKYSLYENQVLKRSDEGETFWFDSKNKPTEKLEKPHYDYFVDCKCVGDAVTLSLPFVDGGAWELYQIVNGKSSKLPLDSNKYSCDYQPDVLYFAKLYVNNILVYQTPNAQIFRNDEQNVADNRTDNNKHEKEAKDEELNILDFWYWK